MSRVSSPYLGVPFLRAPLETGNYHPPKTSDSTLRMRVLATHCHPLTSSTTQQSKLPSVIRIGAERFGRHSPPVGCANPGLILAIRAFGAIAQCSRSNSSGRNRTLPNRFARAQTLVLLRSLEYVGYYDFGTRYEDLELDVAR
jgi:hypothetical protein